MAIPGLPGVLIIYQGHLFALKGHLCGCVSNLAPLKMAGQTPKWSLHVSMATTTRPAFWTWGLDNALLGWSGAALR